MAPAPGSSGPGLTLLRTAGLPARRFSFRTAPRNAGTGRPAPDLLRPGATTWCALALAAVLPGLACAADWRDCRSLTDPAERLACYDRLADAAGPEARSGQPKPDPATASAAPEPAPSPSPTGPAAPTPEELFGRDAVAAEQLVRESAGIERLEEIHRRVVAVRVSPASKLVITLDNGQVWEQIDSPMPRITAGTEVRIRSAAFGSYLLGTENTPRGVRVRRLR